MLRLPPFVVMPTSAVPAGATRLADSMMAPVTVSELFGLITMSFTAPIVGGRGAKRQHPVASAKAPPVIRPRAVLESSHPEQRPGEPDGEGHDPHLRTAGASRHVVERHFGDTTSGGVRADHD